MKRTFYQMPLSENMGDYKEGTTDLNRNGNEKEGERESAGLTTGN